MPADKESGVLRTTAQTSSRPLAALLLCGAVLVVPLLLIKSGADAAPSEGSGSRSHHPSADAAPVPSAAEAPATGAGGSMASPPSTPPPAAPPATAQLASTGPSQAEATLTAQNVAHHAPLVEVAPTTTTSAPPPPTTTTTTTTFRPLPPPVAGSTHYGQVTYYDHPAGRCASPYLAFGTVVRITNPANGESVSCVVDDREADTARSIDLATASFALIAPLGQGVIDAELSW